MCGWTVYNLFLTLHIIVWENNFDLVPTVRLLQATLFLYQLQLSEPCKINEWRLLGKNLDNNKTYLIGPIYININNGNIKKLVVLWIYIMNITYLNYKGILRNSEHSEKSGFWETSLRKTGWLNSILISWLRFFKRNFWTSWHRDIFLAPQDKKVQRSLISK